ncbi:hypothetical protein BG005_010087 [Podila minutissima]|nr:hypothetical protein BG005_010087 [Podila minutissima]
MTFTTKATATLLSLTCVIQAVPLDCAGNACYPASSGNVNVGSATNIFPVTNVTPITRYQPIVQGLAPIVQSECSHGFGSPLGSSMLGLGLRQPLFTKRHMSSEKTRLRADCVPSAADSCEPLDSGTTQLGSSVTAVPSNVVLPSTSQAPEVLASPAEHTVLGASNVDLGSALIQPATHVVPSTVYQPSFEHKGTIVESETGEHQNLARSSVELGSQTTIRPTTYVEPLTVIRPKIKTLPADVSELGCDGGGAGLQGLGLPSFAAGFPFGGLGRPGSTFFMSPVSNVYEIQVVDDDEKVKLC